MIAVIRIDDVKMFKSVKNVRCAINCGEYVITIIEKLLKLAASLGTLRRLSVVASPCIIFASPVAEFVTHGGKPEFETLHHSIFKTGVVWA